MSHYGIILAPMQGALWHQGRRGRPGKLTDEQVAENDDLDERGFTLAEIRFAWVRWPVLGSERGPTTSARSSTASRKAPAGHLDSSSSSVLVPP